VLLAGALLTASLFTGADETSVLFFVVLRGVAVVFVVERVPLVASVFFTTFAGADAVRVVAGCGAERRSAGCDTSASALVAVRVEDP
jgi:hypothetical protein